MENMKENKYRILGLCLFLCGFFSTSPVLSLIIEGHVLSLYNVFFTLSFLMLILICLFKNKIKLYNNSEQKMMFFWLFLVILSCLFGMIYYINRELWFDNAIKYFFHAIIYLVYVVMMFNVNCKKFPRNILGGVKWGAIINLMWVAIDAVYYYIFLTSLTNNVFSSYIIAKNVRHGSIDTFEGLLIRPAGFNEDPASVGMFAPLILFVGLMERKKWMIVLAGLSIIFSGSNTSFVCCLFVLFMYIFLGGKKIFKISKKVVSIVISLLVLSLICYSGLEIFSSRIAQITDRLDSVYLSGDVENLRVTYFTQLPNVIINQNFKLLTGTGLNSASDGYLQSNIDSANLRWRSSYFNEPYDVENLYISYLLDSGIIGFVFFILLLFRLYKKARKLVVHNAIESYVLALGAMLAIISSSFFYHYTLYSVHILCWVAICTMNDENLTINK